jgi:hypothetical protein
MEGEAEYSWKVKENIYGGDGFTPLGATLAELNHGSGN